MEAKTGKVRRYDAELTFGPVPADMDIDVFAAQQHGGTVTIDREARTVTLLPYTNSGRLVDA